MVSEQILDALRLKGDHQQEGTRCQSRRSALHGIRRCPATTGCAAAPDLSTGLMTVKTWLNSDPQRKEATPIDRSILLLVNLTNTSACPSFLTNCQSPRSSGSKYPRLLILWMDSSTRSRPQSCPSVRSQESWRFCSAWIGFSTSVSSKWTRPKTYCVPSMIQHRSRPLRSGVRVGMASRR